MGDLGLMPGLGRSPKEGLTIHSSFLAWTISMDRGAWRAAVYGVAKSQTRLSNCAHQHRVLTDSPIHASIISTLTTMKENVSTIFRGCILVNDELHQLLVLLKPVVMETTSEVQLSAAG